jgi:hypothetical protein
MRQICWVLILCGLFLAGAGCGGGGGSSSTDSDDDTDTGIPTINVSMEGTYTINLSYTVTNSSGDTIKMTIKTIEVKSDTLIVNYTWKATNNTGCAQITKLSDEGKTTFYMKDDDGAVYNHTAGAGAAYSQSNLSSTAVSGSYTFPAPNSSITALYFCDDDYDRTLGPITVTES